MAQQLEWDKIKFPFKVPVTLTISETEKLVFEGELLLEIHRNSYKYPVEAVLTCWSSAYPRLKPRAQNNGFSRLEVPVNQLSDLRDFFLKSAQLIDMRLKGIALETPIQQ